MRSHNREIKLLPALPDAWPEGEVTGIRVRGDFTLDIEWSAGKLTEAAVMAGRNVTGDSIEMVYTGMKKIIRLKAGQSIRLSASDFRESAGDRATKSTTNTPDEIIEYKTVGGVSLSLHVFYPPNHSRENKTPAIMFFHGGGWKNGHPSAFYRQSAHLASRGMVAIMR